MIARSASRLRARLFWSASLATLVAAGVPAARAQSLGALMAATHQAVTLSTTVAPTVGGSSASTSVSAMAAASARAQQYQAQAAAALSLAQQAQAAGLKTAQALDKAAGVPNGLVAGGLRPVANPVLAAADPTGLNTWQGANAPTASGDQVTVVQTAARAVLDWTSFNVGQATTLTFRQQLNGVNQPSWVVLNRVVGSSASPATILGSISAPGTVLVLDQNGILFGGTAQVNVGALIASSLEIGHAIETDTATGVVTAIGVSQRDTEFLNFGLLGFAEENPAVNSPTFSELATVTTSAEGQQTISYAVNRGEVQVQAGASLTSADSGYIMLLAPTVFNAGQLSSADGEVALQSGSAITLAASEGNANSPDPDVRGLVATGSVSAGDVADSVENAAGGLIQAPRGYVSLGASPQGAVTDAGVILSTTSVSENGYVNLSGAQVDLAPNALISIGPDSGAATIPQDSTSLSAFKPSRVRIGLYTPGSTNLTTGVTTTPITQGGTITIGSGSLIYAPSANISIGADANDTPQASIAGQAPTNVTVAGGAVIDAAGLTNVLVPASRNSLEISPVKGNELADTPAFLKGALNGTTVYLDPRLSGVTANGVAWVGSPLISAAAYAQQVGIPVTELMVAGGNVTLGVPSTPTGSGLTSAAQASQINVMPGAVIDISGGWKTYQAGEVIQSYLVDASGEVVPISKANPDDIYVGVYTGYTVSQSRWGVTQTYSNPVLTGAQYEGQYTEGQDAGSLTLTGSVIALNGQVFAAAYPGAEQILGATPGTNVASATNTAAISGDLRALQAAPSQLPAGGYLDIQAVGLVNSTGGGDVVIAGPGAYVPGPGTTNTFSAPALSAMGLGQLTIQTSGKLTVTADAAVTLDAGGAFEALAGGTISIDGAITVPAGSVSLTTADLGGSVFAVPATSLAPGSFDIVINGQLNVAGRWANDFNAAAGALAGSAYLNGGSITLDAAPRITADGADTPVATAAAAPANTLATDVSGSILINPGALLNASGGGYVTPTGGFILSATGGSVSLYDDTTYFQVAQDPTAAPPTPGGLPGLRVNGLQYAGGTDYIAVNPAAVTARVAIADGSIADQAFGGGGTFTLTTPAFAFGAAPTAPGGAGAVLPLDFFTNAGFAKYSITTYETALIPNFATSANSVCQGACNGYFDNGLGGYNALLRTDVVTVAAGQTLNLTQSYLSPILGPGQIAALQGLGTGASLISARDGAGNLIVPASVPTDAWDQKPVSLTLGGLTELDVAAGGMVTGAPGASLTVGELYNEGANAVTGQPGGVIRLPGGTITQSLIMPPAYGDIQTPIGVAALSDVFSTQNGVIQEDAANAMGLVGAGGQVLTNAQVAAAYPIYLLGNLNAGEGVRLGFGSVTDLSGVAVVDPRAEPAGNLTIANFTDGTVFAGGSLISTEVFPTGGSLFRSTPGASAYSQLASTQPAGLAETLTAQSGSVIDLSGAQAVFDRPIIPDAPPTAVQGGVTASYAPTLEWSNGGNLTLGSGGTITGATILAQGGAPLALGGTLTVLNPILYQSDPSVPTANAVAADTVMAAAFATFVAEGSLQSSGPVTLTLPRSFYLETPPTYQTGNINSAQNLANAYSPTIGAGGRLEIDAPYIALDGAFQNVSETLANAPIHEYEVFLNAGAIDVTGAVLFDRTVERVTLNATGDLRLIGVGPSLFGVSTAPAPTLAGVIEAAGNITLDAAQVYPTTGTTFAITSSGRDGVIQILGPGGATPATPYSAGGNLLIQAATIEQDGVVRAPLGTLTLGSDTPLNTFLNTDYAQPTTSLTLGPNSVTSVSAEGLTIPYGTTTDQVEWYFSPTSANPLTAPPAGTLKLAGASVAVNAGAVVDLKGGGDVYAYEFISGPGGTRDVLDQYNSDPFSSNSGCQYADCRQVYAIVPGLSNAQVAALDPIYSTNYGSLYAPTQAGLSVYLNAAPSVGLAAGWYTLLPAQYALLPGGLRVVQDTGASIPPPLGGAALSDGTVATSGYFGVAGVNTRASSLDVFDIQSQALIHQESDIALTYGAATFAADAAHDGTVTPQLPIDAGRLILSPLTALTLDGSFLTTPGAGGRGSEVDISGTSLVIDPASPADAAAPAAGTIVLTDASLSNLNASSLLIGGIRADNADGTTSLDITTNSLTVASGVSLSAPEILLATDGKGASLTIAGGASIVASGAVTGEPTGAYVVDGSVAGEDAQGAFVRISDGPARLLTRLNVNAAVTPGTLTIGAATLGSEQGAASLPDGAIDLDSLGAFSLSGSATITTNALAVAAGALSFGAGGPGLVVTPALQALFGKAQSLTLASQNEITFAPGAYTFGDLTLNTPGLAATGPGAVSLALNPGDSLTLRNSAAAPVVCVAACGTGALALSATRILFGPGTIDVSSFGGGVALTAPSLLYGDGASVLNAGAAALTLNTSFLGDAGSGVAGAALPSLALVTTGAVAIAGAAPGSAFAAPAGTPGSALTIDAGAVGIKGTALRATAGALTIKAASGGIAISGGAVLAAPAYAQTFGDAADPVTVSAPGGLLSLTALAGNIGVSADSTLSIGGAAGQAGSLSLTAQSGQVYAYDPSTSAIVPLSTVFSTGAAGASTAPLSGASLALDTGGAFDLSAFAAPGGAGRYFTGAVSVRTGAGNLTLGAGDSLAAASVALTADGGQFVDSGLIDTAGINGGAVSLYGAGGVHLTSTAVIDARASGYGATSTPTLRASGGAVTLGVAGAGAIAVDPGATIDVAALNTANRLVEMNRDGGSDYTYVAGDVGGVVTFRAPVITGVGGDTVNVTVAAGAVQGAGGVVLQGYQSWNLAGLAANPGYAGVTVSGGTATLDLSATGAAGQINPLADPSGPLVQFVQNFNISADYASLGGLASQANFHAQPGIELDYAGNIVLASNWNLGAGVVNVSAAVAAGLMVPDPGLPGRYAVVSATEAQLLTPQFTNALYRVGGSFYNEPGTLTIRAGGDLTLDGSVTDGFFQFADQTDPGYLAALLHVTTSQGVLSTSCYGACATIQPWTAGSTTAPKNYLVIDLPGAADLTTIAQTVATGSPVAPYSALANSPAAMGSMANGAGDPLGSAQLFPILPGSQAVSSWSYQLVAGAAASANPLATTAGGVGQVTVQGYHVYGYGADTFATTNPLELAFRGGDYSTGDGPGGWLSYLESAFPKLNPGAFTIINTRSAPAAVLAALPGLLQGFAAAYPHDSYSVLSNGDLSMGLTAAADFMSYLSANFSAVSAAYTASINGPTVATWAVAPTLVRTGNGAIQVAASGDIDLSNAHVLAGYAGPTNLDAAGQLVPVTAGGLQLGGAAIYTAGQIASLGDVTATDGAATPAPTSYQVALGANILASDNLATNPNYDYGAFRSGYAGILIADPVYADGGGAVTLTAGGGVLGRRDTVLEGELGNVGGVSPNSSNLWSWIGFGDQPWRTGSIGSVTNARIDPQLFQEGVGTLAGGNVSITAAGAVSDLTITATDSLTTANVGAAGPTGQPVALVALGGGNVSVIAGGDMLGGRLDVASGKALVKVQGAILSAGELTFTEALGASKLDNALRVRLSDGVVAIQAGGDVDLQGIAALGVSPGVVSTAGYDTSGFYSAGAAVSILADGAVNIANAGYDARGLTLNQQTAAVYPGSFEAVAFTGGLNISTASTASAPATEVLLYPDPNGSLTLLAAGDIGSATAGVTTPTVIAQLDSDPTILPGAFSQFLYDPNLGVTSGLAFEFPAVLPNTPDVLLREYHDANPTHAGDPTPNRIASGVDILDLTLTAAKQTRIAAGRDIVNMVFVGQNLAATDVTRVTAGRDITATTTLETPIVKSGDGFIGPSTTISLPVVQGDTFVLGGPGAFFLEAGRDAGPFLNSAVTDGYYSPNGQINDGTGVTTYGAGILTVGNLWNPALPSRGAGIYTEFGVANGQNFAGLVSDYLDPALTSDIPAGTPTLASLPGYLFLQTTDASGNQTPMRSASDEIYALSLADWERSIAADVISRYDTTIGASTPPANAPALIQFMEGLKAGGSATFAQALAYLPQLSDRILPLDAWLLLNDPAAQAMTHGGTQDLTFTQDMAAFQSLSLLAQREFLITDVYFNELIETSVPTSPSYLDYSRGYTAVNTLFPASDGYTANNLSGGLAGAATTVETGNLDLRLATIQTEEGGDIAILGPGGRVLAGSTVATAVQASRRVYEGGLLYSGDQAGAPFISTITSIPAGYEGVLTLRGGSIDSFTDGDFLLNQSRAFTEQGGDIAIWSSNADVNAGQGPRTTADVPPVQVLIDEDGYSQVSTTSAVSGAGIGAFAPDAEDLAPDVFLMAPRGTVDAGAAGVRSAGNVFIAAFQVANADAIQAQGTVSGAGGPAAVNVSAQTSGDAASAAAAQAAQAVAGGQNAPDRPVILVDVLGFLADESETCSDEERKKGRCY
jgi:filamentous hemagglutinin family protein